MELESLSEGTKSQDTSATILTTPSPGALEAGLHPALPEPAGDAPAKLAPPGKEAKKPPPALGGGGGGGGPAFESWGFSPGASAGEALHRRCRVTCRDFPYCTAHCPILFAVLTMAGVAAFLALAWPGLDVDTNLDAFLEADGESNRIRAAFLNALPFRGAAGGASGSATPKQRRRMQASAHDPPGTPPYVDPNLLHKVVDLKLMYQSTSDDAMTNPRTLVFVREVELRLRRGPKWMDLCQNVVTQNLGTACDPGVSMANLVWPEYEGEDVPGTDPSSQMKLTGMGVEPMSLDAAATLVDSRKLAPVLFPTGEGLADRPKLIRSYFEFNLKCCYLQDSQAVRRASLAKLTDKYQKFIADELLPTLLELKEKGKKRQVDLLWDGDMLNSYETMQALQQDALMAVPAAVFILAYLTWHTRSPLLSIGSLFLALLSIPLAFVLSATISGSNRITGVYFLSLFLIIGNGADAIIVFLTFWDESRELYDERDFPKRLKHLYQQAGLAGFATALTSAASFYSNLASVLRALREFGFFMGTCIMLAYAVLFAACPAVLVTNELLSMRVRHWKCWRRCQWREPSADEEAAGGGAASAGCVQKLRGMVRLINSIDYNHVLIERALIPYRWSCNIFFVVLTISFAVWTAAEVQVDSGTPSIFPAGHNEHDMPLVSPEFSPFSNPWSPLEAKVTYVRRDVDRDGDLSWCNIGTPAPVTWYGEVYSNGTGTCKCRPSEPWSTRCYRHTPCPAPAAAAWCSNATGGFLLDAQDCDGDGVADPACLSGTDAVTFFSSSLGCTAKRGQLEDCITVRGNYKAKQAINILVESRFVGLDDDVPTSFWSGAAWKEHVKDVASKANRAGLWFDSAALSDPNVASLGTLVEEHWETGSVHVAPFFLAPTSRLRVSTSSPPNPGNTSSYCDASEICYCGAPACSLLGEPFGTSFPEDLWTTISVPAGSTPPSSELTFPRALQEAADGFGRPPAEPAAAEPRAAPVLPDRSRRLQLTGVDVTLIWGLVVTGKSPLLGQPPANDWAFNPDFHPDGPSVQRHLLATCQGLDKEEMLISFQTCWVQDFRDWLRNQGQLFPVRAVDFNSLVHRFSAKYVLPSGMAAADALWFDDRGRVKATFVQFDVRMSYTSTPSYKVLAFKDRWDKYVAEVNRNAPMDAGDCWHTSALWIRAEAEDAIVSSTVNTVVASLVSGFLGAFAFTRGDFWLSLLVFLSVVYVTVCLAFFMVVMMGWKLGAVEVLGLIVFVGYSVTSALHIAHRYRDHVRGTASIGLDAKTRRCEAVRFALKTTTSAAVGQAITTLGSAFFLFFCIMQIFVKLAAVLFAVTIFSTVFSIAQLPASLLCHGPLGYLCECLLQLTAVPMDGTGGQALTGGHAVDKVSFGSGSQPPFPRAASNLSMLESLTQDGVGATLARALTGLLQGTEQAASSPRGSAAGGDWRSTGSASSAPEARAPRPPRRARRNSGSRGPRRSATSSASLRSTPRSPGRSPVQSPRAGSSSGNGPEATDSQLRAGRRASDAGSPSRVPPELGQWSSGSSQAGSTQGDTRRLPRRPGPSEVSSAHHKAHVSHADAMTVESQRPPLSLPPSASRHFAMAPRGYPPPHRPDLRGSSIAVL